MQIREIHIDGFGVFRDRHIRNLASGANILYGPNEFGKSTLLNFVRRMLFGFKTPANASEYPALAGGSYGGRLVCEMSSGQVVTISRKDGKSGGPVKILIGTEEREGQEALNHILGQVTPKFYENVYAVGLDELQTMNSLDESEIRTQIYGAGLELGATSLKDIEKSFTDIADPILKKRAGTRLTEKYEKFRAKEKEISDVLAEMEQYDSLVQEAGQLQKEIEALKAETESLEKDKRDLENQQKLYGAYDELKEAEQKLAETAETPAMHENSLSGLEKLEAETAREAELLAKAVAELDRLKAERDAQEYDAKIIEAEPRIAALSGKETEYRNSVKDITPTRIERENLSQEIDLKIGKLGAGWTAERAAGFIMTHELEDISRATKERMAGARQAVENSKSKLQVRLDAAAAEKRRRPAVPATVKFAGAAGIVFGTTGIVLGIVLGEMLLSGFAAAFLIVGGAVLAASLNRKAEAADPLAEKYREELASAQAYLDKITAGWQDELRKQGFSDSRSPDGLTEMLHTIEQIQAAQAKLKDLDSRINLMQDSIDSVNSALHDIFNALGKTRFSEDAIECLNWLNQKLNEAREARNKRTALEEQIRRQESQIKIQKENLEKAREELRQYISSAGAVNAEDFRTRFANFKMREELKTIIEERRKTIHTTVGRGEEYERFMEAIEKTNPGEIATRLEGLKLRLAKARVECDQKLETRGKLQNQIERLSSRADLELKRSEAEVLKQQLKDLALEWVRAKLGLLALEKAIAKYENTRQPEVIRAAGSIFAGITGQAYTMVVKTTKDNELKIQDAAARNKRLLEMSRGTREQLYLAMRLGLIETNEKTREPMPVIMDDILVNFDDERARAAVKAIVDFARGRQVIILTCHKETLEMYRGAGARMVEVGE